MRMMDEGEPIYEIAPLDEMRELGRYKIDTVAFCAKKKFIPKAKRNICKIFLTLFISNSQRCTQNTHGESRQQP